LDPCNAKKDGDKEKSSSKKRPISPEPEQESKKQKQKEIEVITLDSSSEDESSSDSSDSSDSDTDIEEGRDDAPKANHQSNRSTPVVLSGSSSASGTPTHPTAASPGSDSIPLNLGSGVESANSAAQFMQALMSQASRRSPSGMSSYPRVSSNYSMSSSNASRSAAHSSQSSSSSGYPTMPSAHPLNPNANPFYPMGFAGSSGDFLNSMPLSGNEMFEVLNNFAENYRSMHYRNNNATRTRSETTRELPDIISIDDD